MKPRLSPRAPLALVCLIGFLVVSQLVGQDGASGLDAAVARLAWSRGQAALAAAALLAAVAWAGYLLARSNPRPGVVAQVTIGALAFVALVLSNAVPGWTMQALGMDRCSGTCRVVRFLLLSGAWAASWCFVLPAVQYWFQGPIDLAAEGRPAPPDGPVTLIALVSTIQPEEFELDPARPAATVRRGRGGTPVEYRLAFGSLASDIERLQDSNWPWQQLLRAVQRYAPRPGLKIVLVGSRTVDARNRGSHEQLATLCRPFLECYPELRGARVEVFPHPLDFEKFNEVRDRLRQCIRDECRSRDVAEPNVFVDITGGQKVASAAAAAATIGTKGQFQYVRTNEPWEVLVSDLHPQAVPSAGG